MKRPSISSSKASPPAPPDSGKSTRAHILRNRGTAWAALGIWAAIIWTGSSLQIGHSVLFRLTLADKFVHALEYGVLGVLAANALLTRRAGGVRLLTRSEVFGGAALIGAVWGWVDEIHQFFVPGRTTDPFDLAADLIGTTVGALLLLRLREKRLDEGMRRDD